jgi:hypothetical protein
MRNYNPDSEGRFNNCINSMSLKKYHDHKNLVLDLDKDDQITLEEILLGLGDIKETAEEYFGEFENIDLRLH